MKIAEITICLFQGKLYALLVSAKYSALNENQSP